MPNAERHFHMTPDGHGGVKLKLRPRFRFHDEPITELDPDGIARTRRNPDENGPSRKSPPEAEPRSKTSTDENGDKNTENTLLVFGPLLPNQHVELVEMDDGKVSL